MYFRDVVCQYKLQYNVFDKQAKLAYDTFLTRYYSRSKFTSSRDRDDEYSIRDHLSGYSTMDTICKWFLD